MRLFGVLVKNPLVQPPVEFLFLDFLVVSLLNSETWWFEEDDDFIQDGFCLGTGSIVGMQGFVDVDDDDNAAALTKNPLVAQ